MKYKHPFLSALAIPSLLVLRAGAQGAPPSAPPARPDAPGSVQPEAPDTTKVTRTVAIPPARQATARSAKDDQLVTFAFEQADLDLVMEQYCNWTDKIYLKTDAVKASITLRSDKKIPTSEAIKVVEAILAMNNIALVPMGDDYIKVVQATAADLTGQGLTINMDPEQEFGSTAKFVTTVIHLNHVTIPEVQAALQHVLNAYGKILTLERSNSIMITDTEDNIRRARELMEFIDQASALIEPRIYEIKYADATEIAAKLNEIVTAAQSDQQTAAKTPVGNPYARTLPGVIRAGARPPGTPAAPTSATVSSTEGSKTAIIQGTVKIMADERTNIIIIFSLEDNFAFFDKIIKVLDVEVEPATTFEVINLEYADAQDLAGTLNDLIGGASSSRSSSGSSSQSSRSGTTPSSSRSSSSRSSSPRSSTSSSRPTSSRGGSSGSAMVTPNASPEGEPASIDNLNRLSEDTKILADERSNSILLMGSKSDIAAIKEVIKSLDVMLEQVVIEAAIFEIGLGDDLRHGIDWLYKSLNADGSPKRVGAWDGSSLVTNSVNSLVSGAFNYYQGLSGLDAEILINLSKTDKDARLIQTPVIMTTDNTEATLSIGEQRPVVTSTDSFSSSGGSLRSNYEYKDIGIQLTVTPRINPQRFVVMEISQKADQIGTLVEIDGNEVPTILNREFEASIAVPDGGTVVLGGLMSTELSDTVSKIPILGDIPFIGRYLFSSVTKTEEQRELIVLMTPHVMTDMAEMTSETERLYKGTSLKQADWGTKNWSTSPLRFIPDPVDTADEIPEKPEKKPQASAPAMDETASADPEPSPASSPADENDEVQQLLKMMEN